MIVPRRICAQHEARAAAIATSWGYTREIGPAEVERAIWFTDDSRTWIAWLVPVPPEALPRAVILHACVQPGHRVPSDWQDAVGFVASVIGAERVLAYIPADCQEELRARVLTRYLARKGWRSSPLGPVLELVP